MIVKIWELLGQLLESFFIREIVAYQDSLGSDKDVSAWFNLGALSGGDWAFSLDIIWTVQINYRIAN